MQKKSVLALLLAVMMILSGCALVSKDEKKDNARVIIDVNGETVTKQVVASYVQNQISQNEYYNQLFSSYYGYSAMYPTDEATVTTQVIDSLKQNLVLKQKAFALGMDQLTDEEKTHAEEHAKEYYDSFIHSVASTYLPNSGLEGDELTAAAEKYVADNDIKTADGRSTYDDFLKSALEDEAVEKLEADIVKDVTVSEDEIKADFDAKVEDAKAAMEADPDAYGKNVMNGTTVYYAPAGYRMVKHILVAVSDEDSKAADEAQTALTEAQDALTNAAEDADKDALQAAVDAAQAAYDEAKAAGMANAKAKADEVYAKATAEGADFDALISEYSADHMPETGYAIREGFASFVEPFVTGAMALQNVGDVSEPVESTYGYHIIKYVSDVQEGPVDLETVRESIYNSLLSTKKNDLTESTIQQWESEAKISTFEDRLK